MAGYETFLFDLDHTLFDSDASERSAYDDVAASVGLVDPDGHFECYTRINRRLWQDVEAGLLAPDDVRVRRFEEFVAELGLDADPAHLADVFVSGLGRHGELYDGAAALLHHLRGRGPVALVTNGLSEVQRVRLERIGLTDVFDAVVVSSEVGVTKPRPEIFGIAFELLGHPSRRSAIMVGDNLGSDIAGGNGFGIATCWYNPLRRPRPDGSDLRPTHDVGALAEIATLAPPAGT